MHRKRAFAALIALFISALAPAFAQTAERTYPDPPSPTLEGMLEIGVRICSAIINGAAPAEAAAVHGVTLSGSDIPATLDANARRIGEFFGSARVQHWVHIERAFVEAPERRNPYLRFAQLIVSEDGSKCHVGGAGRGDVAAALGRSLSAAAPWDGADSLGGVLLVDTWRASGNENSFVDIRMTRRPPDLHGPNVRDGPNIR